MPEIDPELLKQVKVSDKLYTENDVSLDPNALPDIKEAEMSASAIPDLGMMTGYIMEMLAFMDSPEMMKKKRENEKEYELVVFHKYRDLMPTKIIDLLMEDKINNLKKIISMFETLNDIKVGKREMTKEYNKFTENVNSEYVYPQFGGKQQFNQKMMEYAKQQKKEGKHK